MRKQEAGLHGAMEKTLEAIMFEHWLRFYFLEESGKDMEFRLPEEIIARIQELYPDLAPIAESLNGRSVDLDTSRRVILGHIFTNLDKDALPSEYGRQILESGDFQKRLELFHIWEQLHENQLDMGFAEFGAWKNLFTQWLKSEGAKKLVENFG